MDAIYARQSVEREDSLSIEGQLERCRFEAGDHSRQEYIDRGFSGKNTNRPAFQRMMRDVRAGRVQKVIVYRLDRISRSILDFAKMMEVFEQKHVEFLSSTEHFDTSTPMGRAMLHICIVFAQLERETIQRRVMDTYADRSKRGLYMGGRVPYGFARHKIQIDGVWTACYAPVDAEIAQIQRIFAQYADPDCSLGEVARGMQQEPHLRGGTWNATRLSEMLKNPVYCQAAPCIYDFFAAQGAQIIHDRAAFQGQGCYLFRGQSENKRADLQGTCLVLAPHAGVIPAEIWLTCRKKLLHSVRCAPQAEPRTWLAGRVKCRKCGYALSVIRSKAAAGRYFVCSGKGHRGCCTGLGTIYAEELEQAVEDALLDHLAMGEEAAARLEAWEQESAALAHRAADAGPALLHVLEQRAAQLTRAIEQTKTARQQEKERLRVRWEALSVSEKRELFCAAAESLHVGDHTIEIVWKC